MKHCLNTFLKQAAQFQTLTLSISKTVQTRCCVNKRELLFNIMTDFPLKYVDVVNRMSLLSYLKFLQNIKGHRIIMNVYYQSVLIK